MFVLAGPLCHACCAQIRQIRGRQRNQKSRNWAKGPIRQARKTSFKHWKSRLKQVFSDRFKLRDVESRLDNYGLWEVEAKADSHSVDVLRDRE